MLGRLMSKIALTPKKNTQRKAVNPQPKQNGKTSIKNAPLAKGVKTSTRTPKMTPTPRGMRVKHRELITTILGSVGDSAVYGQMINPQNSEMFQWLTQIAANFELYTFHKLEFYYEPFVSATTNGAVSMAVDYDASDGYATTRQTLMSYEGATRGPGWEGFKQVVKGQNSIYKQRFCTPNGVNPSGTDPKLYNVGSLQVWTTAFPNTNPIGELYVDYDVEFFKPQTQSLASVLYPYVSEVISGGTMAPLTPFGTAVSTLGGLASATSSTIRNFTNAGRFLVQLHSTGNTTSYPTLTASDSNIVIEESDSGYQTGVGAWFNAIVTITQAASVLGSYLTYAVAGTTVTQSGARITPFPYL